MAGLPGYPVVVVHVEDPPGSGLAACCGEQLPAKAEHAPGTVLWSCTGCWGPVAWSLEQTRKQLAQRERELAEARAFVDAHTWE